MNNTRSSLRFLIYAAVGAVGTIAQYLFLVIAVSMHSLRPVAASMIGAVIGAIVNYALNFRFTFPGAQHRNAIPKYAITALLGIGCTGLLMKVMTVELNWNYIVAQLLTTIGTLLVTYSINRIWTFNRREVEA